MKVGFEFTLNGANCIICDIKNFMKKKYANVCLENNEKIDYKIFELENNNNKINMKEVKNEELLNKIMPLFIFDNINKEDKPMIEKYLPIGSVVLLKNAKKRVMITGFACKSEESTKTFDYCGCLYPEGLINSNQNMLFDHNQIETIFFIGYNDEENKQFIEKLKNITENKQTI